MHPYLKKKKKTEVQQVSNDNSRNTESFSSITVEIRKLREKRFISLSPFLWNSLEVSNLDAFTVNPASFEVPVGLRHKPNKTAGTS